MKMKKISLTLSLMLVLLIAACGGATTAEPVAGSVSEPQPIAAEPVAESAEVETDEVTTAETDEESAEIIAETEAKGSEMAEAESNTPLTAMGLPRTIVDLNGEEVVIEDDSQIIALDGPVTEIVYALGAGDRVVATDVSSTYPEAATELPQVGYVRRLSAEPVLAMSPSLIITTDSSGPPEALEQLRESGVPIAMFKSAETVDESFRLVREVAAALGLEREGEALVEKMQADLAEVEALLARAETTPRVMFIYARGLDTVSAAGTDTSVEVMLEMAGAENAITEWEGYQPLTSESAVSIAPDVFLLFSSGLESVGGAEGLLTVPGLAETPAGLEGRIYAMDGLLLTGLGPRVGEAVRELTLMLHPELAE